MNADSDVDLMSQVVETPLNLKNLGFFCYEIISLSYSKLKIKTLFKVLTKLSKKSHKKWLGCGSDYNGFKPWLLRISESQSV